MDIAGDFTIDVPAERAIAACHDPENLQLLLPITGTVTRVGEASYDLLLTPNTPLIKTALPGKLDITATQPGAVYDLTGVARVALLGGVQMMGTLRFVPTATGCQVSYRSSITGSGLVARLLTAKEDFLRERLVARFQHLRGRIVAA